MNLAFAFIIKIPAFQNFKNNNKSKENPTMTNKAHSAGKLQNITFIYHLKIY